MKRFKTNKTVPVQIRMTKSMLKQSERLVKDGLYINISEVIRDSVRKKLEGE